VVELGRVLSRCSRPGGNQAPVFSLILAASWDEPTALTLEAAATFDPKKVSHSVSRKLLGVNGRTSTITDAQATLVGKGTDVGDGLQQTRHRRCPGRGYTGSW
jgi:hypothetical protein